MLLFKRKKAPTKKLPVTEKTMTLREYLKEFQASLLSPDTPVSVLYLEAKPAKAQDTGSRNEKAVLPTVPSDEQFCSFPSPDLIAIGIRTRFQPPGTMERQVW